MDPLHRQILLKAFKLFDLWLMTGCFLLSTLVVGWYQSQMVPLSTFLEMRIKISNALIFLGLLAIWHAIFSLYKLYSSRRLSPRKQEIVDVIQATSLGTIIIALFAVVFQIKLITPVFLGVFWLSVTALTIGSRLLLRLALAQIRLRDRNLRYMLVIGTNPRGVAFARKIEARPQLGYRILGFVDEVWKGTENFAASGYKIVSDIENLPVFLRERVVDEVFISLPIKSYYDQITAITGLCEKHGIIVRFSPEIFPTKLGRSRAEHFAGGPMITVSTGAMKGWPVLVKRLLDVTISFILLLAHLPLLALIALAIRWTSLGPIFFVQERVGLNKRRFRLYKFRTMIPNAEKKQAELEHLNEVKGPAFKMKDDPRITPIGKFLRKTSLDELPQLLNVFKGDMSLVGPRPLPVRDYNGFSHDWQRRRFSVRPGITCLWQVNGRSNVNFKQWMELDMHYIDHWSLWLDLKILFMTVPVVLRGSGAA